MTAIWGPIGWMTLHSCSVSYPERPTNTDKRTVSEFIRLVGETITCPTCKSHFKEMFDEYTRKHQDWNSSRYNFFTMICRFHNEVNKRLNKPVYRTVSECLNALIIATSQRSQREYREAYLNHISNFWGSQRIQHGDGLINYNVTKRMREINEGYFNQFNVDYKSLAFAETDVVETSSHMMYDIIPPIKIGGFKKVNGRFSLLNR